MWVTKADNGEYSGVPGTYQYFSNRDTKEEDIHTSLVLDSTTMETTQEILLVRVLYSTTLRPLELNNQVWAEIIYNNTEAQILLT